MVPPNLPDITELGPLPNTRIKEIHLLYPPPLIDCANRYLSWAHSKQTPIVLKLLDEGLKEPIEPDIIKVIVYSEKVSETYFKPLKHKLLLMNLRSSLYLRLWPIDGSLPPNELSLIYHPKRMKALSLLLGGLTLPKALQQAHQAMPLGQSSSLPDLKQTQTHFHFSLDAIEHHIKALRKYASYSRVPSLLGLIITILVLISINETYTSIYLTIIFVTAQLLIGLGVIGTLWSAFEYRSFRQRVYLFWVDSRFCPQKENHGDDHPTTSPTLRREECHEGGNED